MTNRFSRLVCWWYGCLPDWQAIHYDAEAVSCERCGAPDTSYADRCGDTRHNRAKARGGCGTAGYRRSAPHAVAGWAAATAVMGSPSKEQR